MEKQIFRKKSVEKVSSPEQLNDYIRISNPSVWMTLAAIIILLAGVCVWGVLGRLETKVSAAALAESGSVVCYVKEADAEKVEGGMTVRIGENEFTVQSVSAAPVAVEQGGKFSESPVCRRPAGGGVGVRSRFGRRAGGRRIRRGDRCGQRFAPVVRL